jgi:acyl-CoA thioester hydrolase
MTNPDPPSGRFDGKTYLFPLRVYYEDTDLSGLVYHASYLRFMERGRSEFLLVSGAGHKGLLQAAEPLAWAVYRMEIDFKRPARIEDALVVSTSVSEVSPARVKLTQTVLKEAEILVNARCEVCIISLDGRPRRMPDAIRRKLASYL